MPPATIAEIVAHLRELGLATAVSGATAGSAPITAVATDAEAAAGDLAWSKRPGAAAGFRGSLLICSAIAAEGLNEPASHSPTSAGSASPAEGPGKPAAGAVIVVSERPRLAMALVVGRFFAHLTADQPAVYADPATARQVDDGRAWVRNAAVGRNVRIEPLATVGCAGMGYERDAQGRLVPFPQLGGVVLADDVHIAAQAMVQRGAIGDTVVRRGAKVGPHVNVGHNAEIGEDCLIAGHAQIGGGARIGRNTVVWQSAAVANGVRVGEGAVIGMGAMIRHDVGDGEVWAGNPGKRLR
jgi:acetyltransferase-like isoleucine patch superfamily enzyme